MRFLHTADWHVGKPLRQRARLDEYAAALDEVARIAVDRKVDVVAGGRRRLRLPRPAPRGRAPGLRLPGAPPAPPASAASSSPATTTTRASWRPLRPAGDLRIHVRADVRPAAQGGVVRVHSRDGREEARRGGAAVRRRAPRGRRLPSSWAPRTVVHGLRRAPGPDPGLPGPRALADKRANLVLAHLLIDGARLGTGERALHLGKVYGLSAQQIPAVFQLAALGHLHRPQEIVAPARTFYSGSLIELDFGETEQEKRVVVADRSPASRPRSSPAAHAGRRLRELRARSRPCSRPAARRPRTGCACRAHRGARPRRGRAGQAGPAAARWTSRSPTIARPGAARPAGPGPGAAPTCSPPSTGATRTARARLRDSCSQDVDEEGEER